MIIAIKSLGLVFALLAFLLKVLCGFAQKIGMLYGVIRAYLI